MRNLLVEIVVLIGDLVQHLELIRLDIFLQHYRREMAGNLRNLLDIGIEPYTASTIAGSIESLSDIVLAC